jgi:FkbM family methyltransferase
LNFLSKSGQHKVFPFKILYNISSEKQIAFTLFASAKMGEKAQRNGIENIITRALYQYSASKNSGMILDIGMNYGFLSTAWATALPQHQIIGFEVSPYIINAVQQTIRENHLSNLVLEHCAVSNQQGEVLGFQFIPGKATRSQNASNTEPVKTTTIDHFVDTIKQPVVAIKIDTDGFDYEVLQGAFKVIETQRPMVVVETNQDPKIISFLLDHNYHIYSMRNTLVISASIDLSIPEYANILCYPEPPRHI